MYITNKGLSFGSSLLAHHAESSPHAGRYYSFLWMQQEKRHKEEEQKQRKKRHKEEEQKQQEKR